MKQFWNIVKHKYFKLAATIMIIFLPLVLVINQQQQDPRGKAEVSTTLSFTPPSTSESPIFKKVGDNFYLDLILKPGQNSISLVKIDILYDSTKIGLSPTNPLVVNETIFPQILEGPVYTTGRVQAVLSVGSDLSKAISTESRVITLNFVAKDRTFQTNVTLGPNSRVFSVLANDQNGENVLSSTSPAYIKIVEF